MDFRNVAGVTIPFGSVVSIKIGNVTVWSKDTGNKYPILVNGVQVDSLTMSRLVKKVQNGDAQTDYGIGAQVVVPYCDDITYHTMYDLPFNLGTFTAYGEGKLGLQAHCAVPSQQTTLAYGNSYSKHIKISMLRVLRYKPLAYYTPLSSPESLIFAHYS